MIAKNKPIPAPIPNFKLLGIEFINQALKGVNDITKNNTPATNTAPRAPVAYIPFQHKLQRQRKH